MHSLSEAISDIYMTEIAILIGIGTILIYLPTFYFSILHDIFIVGMILYSPFMMCFAGIPISVVMVFYFANTYLTILAMCIITYCLGYLLLIGEPQLFSPSPIKLPSYKKIPYIFLWMCLMIMFYRSITGSIESNIFSVTRNIPMMDIKYESDMMQEINTLKKQIKELTQRMDQMEMTCK